MCNQCNSFVHYSEMVLQFGRRRLRRLMNDFEVLAFDLFWEGRLSHSPVVRDRRIRAWTGCSVRATAKAWHSLSEGHSERNASKEKFLWALHALACHPGNDEDGASRCGGVDEKTHRKWVWHFTEELACLEDDAASQNNHTCTQFCHCSHIF